jgi:hypothetical protein
MTKFYSSLVFSALAALLFSCSSDGIVTNDPDAQTPGLACKQGSVSYDDSLVQYDKLDPSCKDEQRRLVFVYDTQEPEIDWDYIYSHVPGYVPGSSGGRPELGLHCSNGEPHPYCFATTIEESVAYKDEYGRKYEEELEKNKKDLDLLCVINNSSRHWLALLSDEEEADLLAKYDDIAIYDYYGESDPIEEDEIGGNAGGSRCGSK